MSMMPLRIIFEEKNIKTSLFKVIWIDQVSWLLLIFDWQILFHDMALKSRIYIQEGLM